MLIETITFEIHNFSTSVSEEFIVENTTDNYEMIASHRFTRAIRFAKMFDFEFAAKESAPKFILFGECVANAYAENANVFEIDDIDEMVGTY